MRKFIVSDIHGDGNIYYSIMNYLDNINKIEDIELYINGDLIDRGYESAEILLDVIKRIKENKFKIVYLGGNHELLMYELFEMRKIKEPTYFNDWYLNGGALTDEGLEELLNDDQEKILKVVNFVSELPLYYKFKEKIDGKNIVLVHAACPLQIDDKCDLKIKDDDELTYFCTWTRKNDPYVPFRSRIGNPNYFSIVGHTPNDNKYGYFYDENENYLNIDGGCARFVSGYFSYDHVPLVEVKDNLLKILTFNNQNEIIAGHYFQNKKSIPLTEAELNSDKKYLNNDLKIKKLVKNEDGAVYYKEGDRI